MGGTWQFQKVSQLSYPPTNSWQTMTVPGFLSGYDYEHAWFRRAFSLPAEMAGTRLKLRFGGVKYDARVYLNGVFVGRYLNGYEPFELDITAAALIGSTNELVVGVSDWTALFAAPVDFSTMGPEESPRDHVRNTILAPIGGRYEQYGIWQPVKVVSLPSVSIEDVFVMPSVRTRQLAVRLTLRNDTGVPQTASVTNRVLDGATTVLALPLHQVVVPAATSLQIDVAAPWTNATWWTHLNPHLYSLETTLTAVTGADQANTRFGFREFWVEGGKYYLNGIPINLLAAATWPPNSLLSTGAISQVLLDVKNGNNVALRLHTQPWDEAWYDLADQIGLLIVEECAVWCDPRAYKLSDPAFWTNYAQHLTAAVKRDRNHPSIVLWSLENEILHCGGETVYSATEAQLAAMGRLVKSVDPTRPITYEADLDPGGEADVLGLHYPFEFPDHQVWPNSAWWMDQPIDRDWVPNGKWTWDRSKPLYIGEFLWVPSTSAADFTILFGDDAYADPSYYRNQAKGLTWKMAIEAYRAYGVNGICPWTIFEDPAVVWGVFDLKPGQNHLYQVQKAAYHPNGVFPEEYTTRFFEGAEVSRTLRIYNDRMSANSFTLRWRAGPAGWQTRSFVLPPAGQRRDSISFRVPAPGPFTLQLELSDATNLLFASDLPCSAWTRSRLALNERTRLGLFDPIGTTAALLASSGLSFSTITNLRTAPYDLLDLLVIGRNALTNEPLPEIGRNTIGSKWQDLACRGGWVLVLEQTNYPSWMPAELRVEDFDASFAFPNPDHPVMQGITSEHLRWWADDHRILTHALASPSRGNVRPLAVVGSRRGLEYAAALELPIGRGGILCSQWLLTQRFDVEPLAGLLLQRLLGYCEAPLAAHLVAAPVALVAETNSAAAARLAEIGLQAENFAGRLASFDPALYPVLVIAGSNAVWQEAAAQVPALASYVERGGKLLLHRPADSFLTAAQTTLFPELDYSAGTLGLVLYRHSTDAAVRLANHDLYWIEQSGSWNRTEILSTNIARRYYRKRFNLPAYNTIQVENMPIHTSGGPAGGGWWLWSNGSVAQDITAGQPGTYLFNVLARGTPVAGVWPQMTLKIDGRAKDTVSVTTNNLAWFTLSADLSEGTHQLAISFDNDAYSPPNEDRNLFLDAIRWGRDSDTSPYRLLTSPGAVAQIRRGAGVIVLDEIAWESETRNAVKASRYASSLLAQLGAALRLQPSQVLEAESMRNVNVSAYSVSQGIVHLNSGGRIETSVRFSAAGTYVFEVFAGGHPAKGVLPQIALTVNGANRTNFFVNSPGISRHVFALPMAEGTQNIGLAFLNDFYDPPEDRNAHVDRLTIAPETPPRIVGLTANPARHTATVQWESKQGTSYEVQVSSNLGLSSWQSSARIGSLGSVCSWIDDGASSGSPPLGPDAPQRFYRIRQIER